MQGLAIPVQFSMRLAMSKQGKRSRSSKLCKGTDRRDLLVEAAVGYRCSALDTVLRRYRPPYRRNLHVYVLPRTVPSVSAVAVDSDLH